MIKMDDTILAIWCIEIRAESDGNWLACLSKRPNGYELEYRFRWYVDDVTYDSADRRNFFCIQFGKVYLTDTEAIHHGREIFDLTRRSLAKNPAGNATFPYTWELIRGARSTDEFVDALAAMPGMHMRKITEQEAERLQSRH
jgi:hypothetical protein